MLRRLPLILSACLFVLQIQARILDKATVTALSGFFSSYECREDFGRTIVVSASVDDTAGTLDVVLNDQFSSQLFRPETVKAVEDGVRSVLPAKYSSYTINIISNGRNIRDLVPSRFLSDDGSTLYALPDYGGEPWVINASKPYYSAHGLEGVHLSVTPSHGYYFDNREKQIWKWQRPALWCTREDLLTQSFVYPYLIPMLENAGAVVASMRERDWQPSCAVADNSTGNGVYIDSDAGESVWESRYGNGYSAQQSRIVTDGSATVRVTRSNTAAKAKYAFAEWRPEITGSGRYAVYVTYQSYANSVTDARYTVCHSGGRTVFLVNQRIGGGTWVYLGTFEFDSSSEDRCSVRLDNSSFSAGLVCADAVRLGGGYGNEAREGTASGKPRYLEGARYYARYSGAPDSIYLKYDGADDYREDIHTRPRMTNWLSGGSIYNPSENGAGVPIELSFALHTDAGYVPDDSIVGSLGICTTMEKNGVLSTGMSRLVSRELTDEVLSGLIRDLDPAIGQQWTIRGLRDDDYCESREPGIPSVLLELLSHQNFEDMKYAFDPDFRFTVSRSLYKSILRYISRLHGRSYTVQPLPVNHFMMSQISDEGEVTLSWRPTEDQAEKTARPDSYIVYTAIDGLGFDNGTVVAQPHYRVRLKPGHIYSFKVAALNQGGSSMPSETLSAHYARRSRETVLIVNCFQRLSGPAAVDTDTKLGFNLEEDAGVQYISSPVLCGYQKIFDRTTHFMSDDEEESLGFSGDEFDGAVLAGNSFNYPYLHGCAIAAGRNLSFVSCSREAVEDGLVRLSDFGIADLIFGLQKSSAADSVSGKDYSVFTTELMEAVEDYCAGGGKLIMSGSYIGSDLYRTDTGRKFAHNILGLEWKGSMETADCSTVTGLGKSIPLVTSPNSSIYMLQHPDILEPANGSIPMFIYAGCNYCAGVAARTKYGDTVVMGFPFESIGSAEIRESVMSTLLEYLTE